MWASKPCRREWQASSCKKLVEDGKQELQVARQRWLAPGRGLSDVRQRSMCIAIVHICRHVLESGPYLAERARTFEVDVRTDADADECKHSLDSPQMASESRPRTRGKSVVIKCALSGHIALPLGTGQSRAFNRDRGGRPAYSAYLSKYRCVWNLDFGVKT